MFIKIDMTCATPIYEQLKQSIIRGIATKALQPGEELPSVRQLASDLSVNMHTVAKAYASLKEDGLISVHRKKGAVINTPEMHTADPEYLSKLTKLLEEYAAHAICKGVTAGEWLNVCNNAYEALNEKRSI